MICAENLISTMRLTPICKSWEWDRQAWLLRQDVRDHLKRSREAFDYFRGAGLIPQPKPDEGRDWAKPLYFVIATMMANQLCDEDIRKLTDAAREGKRPLPWGLFSCQFRDHVSKMAITQ
jgi:hypothetical protein